MNFDVYILYSPTYDKFYIGQTSDLPLRVHSHNNTFRSTFTSKFRPWELFWHIGVPSRSLAMEIEKYLKNKNKIFYKRLISDADLEKYIKERFDLQ